MESEAAADSAFHASVELRCPFALPAGGDGLPFDFYPYLFYDGAFMALNDPLPGEETHFKIQGAGAGLRGERRKIFHLLPGLGPRPGRDGTTRKTEVIGVYFKTRMDF